MASIVSQFVTEGQQEEEDFIFFGYVIGDFEEWGNFSLTELQNVNDVRIVKIIVP